MTNELFPTAKKKKTSVATVAVVSFLLIGVVILVFVIGSALVPPV